MPNPYYTFPAPKYPPVTLAVLEAVRLYICTRLYPTELYANAQQRFILADIGSNFTLREGIHQSKITNLSLPFTAYNVTDMEEVSETFNMFATTQNYYSSILNCKIYARPVKLSIPMVTFFPTAKDYDRARTIFVQDNAAKSLTEVPITINGVLTSIPAVLNFELSKGSYAMEFEQQLVAGDISDLVHNVTVYYYELIVDADVSPVDDIVVSMGILESERASMEAYHAPDTPIVSTSSPVNNATSIAVDNSIVLTFNVPMNEQSVEDALLLSPLFDADLIWNATSTQLAIDPVNSLDYETVYTIEIADSAMSGDEIPFEKDFSLQFTTEEEGE